MRFFEYEEGIKHWCRPRHPFVSLHDITIVCLALFFVYATEDWLRLYFVIVAVMFAISALHHWLPDQRWHCRLDRSAIQIMIAGTTLPYAEYILASGGGWWFGMLWVWATVLMLIKITFGSLMSHGWLPPMVYVVTGLLAVMVMVPVGLQLESWAILFWLGVGFYTIQLIPYNKKWFDFYLEKFGYREVQHLILLVAVGCHSFAALSYA
jgi:hemolysin III